MEGLILDWKEKENFQVGKIPHVHDIAGHNFPYGLRILTALVTIKGVIT